MKDFIEINVPKDHPARKLSECIGDVENTVYLKDYVEEEVNLGWEIKTKSIICPYVCGSEDELCCHNNNPSKRCKEHDCPIRVGDIICPYSCGENGKLCCHPNNPSKRCKEHDCPI